MNRAVDDAATMALRDLRRQQAACYERIATLGRLERALPELSPDELRAHCAELVEFCRGCLNGTLELTRVAIEVCERGRDASNLASTIEATLESVVIAAGAWPSPGGETPRARPGA
jgi:hypothetical protein